MRYEEAVAFLFKTGDFCIFGSCLDLSLVVRYLNSNCFLLSFMTVRRNEDIFKTLHGISVVKYLTCVGIVLGHSVNQGGCISCLFFK